MYIILENGAGDYEKPPENAAAPPPGRYNRTWRVGCCWGNADRRGCAAA
jgi:hypothetical protein